MKYAFLIGGFAIVLSLHSPAEAGLTAYYKLDEASGPTAFDSSGNGNNGTYSNDGVTYGVAGANSSDAAISIANSGFVTANLTLTPSFTVEVFAKSVDAAFNAYGWIASARHGNGFIIHPEQNFSAWTGYITNASDDSFNAIGTYDAADIQGWHQYGLSYDSVAGVGKMYFDGLLVAERDLFFLSRGTSTIPVYLGQDDPSFDAGRFGSGALDEFKLYTTALTDDAVHSDFISGTVGIVTPEPATFVSATVAGMIGIGIMIRNRRKATAVV